MENKLEKRYGLFTAICMVVGIVIGSGVFFKAQTILEKTDGNMPLGILAWLIGGCVMIVCVLAFSGMAQRYEKVNGVVDYAEATVSKGYAYAVGWFMTTIYYPAMTSVLAWLSARYTLVFITSCWPNFKMVIPASQGGCVMGPECFVLTLIYMCLSYGLNALSPKLAGHFQTTTTVIKLIPLGLMAVVGIIVGLTGPEHMLVNNFQTMTVKPGDTTSSLLLAAVCSTAFAYEGWIIATSINAELKDSKRNLPKALIIGGIIVMSVYIAYYVGVAGGAPVETLIHDGATSAFVNIFGGVFGNILNLFIAISCLGTLNGLMLGCCRGMYSVAVRRQGFMRKAMRQVDDATNMPNNSAVFGLIVCVLWGGYFYFANLLGTWTDVFVFDSSELPIITIYAFYIPIFICWMIKEKEVGFVKRFLLPSLAILGSLFMVYACIVGHKMGNVWYLIIFAVIMLIGVAFYKKERNADSATKAEAGVSTAE